MKYLIAFCVFISSVAVADIVTTATPQTFKLKTGGVVLPTVYITQGSAIGAAVQISTSCVCRVDVIPSSIQINSFEVKK